MSTRQPNPPGWSLPPDPTNPERARNQAPHRGSFVSGGFLPLALITLGVIFLLGNTFQGPGRGGLIMLGLGAAFLIGRLTTGRYGYAVPAGLLIALGTFVGLREVQHLEALHSGGWFFILLGLGFALIYLIGLQPGAVWPLFPATVLIALGVMLFGVTSLAPLAAFAWIVTYWPAALVILGIWLLFRDQLPAAIRQPLGTIGGLLLLGYGLLAAASAIAAGGAFARAGFLPSFGFTPYSDTITLSQPIAAGETLDVTNLAGKTTIRASGVDTVTVTVTRHFNIADQPPSVALTRSPSAAGVRLEVPEASNQSWVEYTIELPATVGVNAQGATGSVEVNGIAAPVSVATTSGDVRLTNLGGDVRVTTGTGDIRASDVRHVKSAQSTTGDINLDGTFTDAATVQSTTGDVQVRFQRASAVHLSVRTENGDIDTNRVPLTNTQSDRRALTATLGSPAEGALLSITTTTGDVELRQ